MSFTSACVLPLCISTAAQALYQSDFLALELPTLATPSSSTPPRGTVLVWGGASACGACAIQLLVLSGYEVYVTCSPKNFEFCRGLGAAQMFDYTQPDVVDSIVAALKGKHIAGIFDTISLDDTLKPCSRIATSAGYHGTIAATLELEDELEAELKEIRGGKVKIMSTFAPAIVKTELAGKIWREFLPEAIRTGRILPRPEAWVVGRGLESLQIGLDRMREGVSARKVVVELV